MLNIADSIFFLAYPVYIVTNNIDSCKEIKMNRNQIQKIYHTLIYKSTLRYSYINLEFWTGVPTGFQSFVKPGMCCARNTQNTGFPLRHSFHLNIALISLIFYTL